MNLREIILAGVFLTISIVTGVFQELNRHQEILDFFAYDKTMRHKLVQNMREQEKFLNIKYKNIPELKYLIPRELGKNRRFFCGYYNQEKNIIYYNSEIEMCGPDETLRHEVAHSYIIKKCLENKTCKNYRESTDDEFKMVISNLMNEGIAEYFDRGLKNKKTEFTDEELPEELEDFKFVIYDAGYHLVKPIIDEFRGKGVDYLIQNPPTPEELFNLPAYRERILEELNDFYD